MSMETELLTVQPTALGEARATAHQAAQFLTRAARANLAAEPDDSHSNIGWQPERNMFFSQPMAGNDGPCFVGLSLSPLALHFVSGGRILGSLDLHGMTLGAVDDWLDLHLKQNGLKAASQVVIPYELPPEVVQISAFDVSEMAPALLTLSAWFGLAHRVLASFADRNGTISPGPSAVRCWPHHFDIATYVGLEDGDFETAKGIGVGLSPGDQTYDQPYVYINPWPHLDRESLPDAPEPGHWHTEGFVGAIATADEVLSLIDIETGLPAFIDDAFSIGREKLGR